MNFKILLIAVFKDPPQAEVEEIGICSIAAVLREKGYKTMLMSAAEMNTDYKKIIEFAPDLIGVTVYNCSKDSAYKFCTKIQKELPGVRICVGGHLPSYHGVEMMEEAGFIDFVVRGEGEFTFLELVSHLEKKESPDNVKGLIFRKKDEIIVNELRPFIPDLNQLPFPSRDILPDNKLKIATIETSRGCTLHCTFCRSVDFWKKWRGKSIPRVLDEIKYLYQQGTRRISFIDNTFEDAERNSERVKEIAQGIKDLNLDITYIAFMRAEFHRKADDQLLTLLKESGLRAVVVGVETANEFDRKIYGKRATLEDNCKIIESLRKHRIGVNVGFINFNPYSTFQGLHKNIDWLEAYGFANFNFIEDRYMLFKGTSLYIKIQRDHLIKEGRYDDQFRYNFIDERIKHVADYINDWVESKNKETNGVLESICDYRYMYLSLLLDYQANFQKAHLSKAEEILLQHEAQVTAILQDLNTRNARWFRELLHLAENHWNHRSADLIMENFVSAGYIRQTLRNLEQKKLEFFYKIIAMGPKYEACLSS